MTDARTKRTHWFQSFRTFAAHFFHICFVFRGLLGIKLILVLSGGLLVSVCEGLSPWQGIYFAIITATSVGYGDIAPATVMGQCISIVLAVIGTIFVGLAVAAATRAVEVTVREYRGASNGTSADENEDG